MDTKKLTELLKIDYKRSCDCTGVNRLNCLDGKNWLKSQVGIWEFNYEKRDIRNKEKHPATFPISLAKKIIELFTHKGELVIDPFVGSGTTLVAARDLSRNAVGFDLKQDYIDLCYERLQQVTIDNIESPTEQIAIKGDALESPQYLAHETASLIFTSPPYANLLNRKRKNKSMRNRKNEQYDKVEQYSQDERDLGTMSLEDYTQAMGDIYEALLPLLKPKGHCVINVPDMWWENERITLHIVLVQELRKRGYELRNTIIWDRRKLINAVGIFGYPSNYITMGTTFEYLLDFWRPPLEKAIETNESTPNINSQN